MDTKDNEDYKQLFKQAIFHLRCVSGSRNSFTLEMQERMFPRDGKRIDLRNPQVECMHLNAVDFLRTYDK